MRRRVVARGIKEAAAERTNDEPGVTKLWCFCCLQAAAQQQRESQCRLCGCFFFFFLPTKVFLPPLSSRWLTHESMNIHLFIFFSYIMFTVGSISAECGLKFILLVHFFWSRKLQFLSPRLNTPHENVGISEFFRVSGRLSSFRNRHGSLNGKLSCAVPPFAAGGWQWADPPRLPQRSSVTSPARPLCHSERSVPTSHVKRIALLRHWRAHSRRSPFNNEFLLRQIISPLWNSAICHPTKCCYASSACCVLHG